MSGRLNSVTDQALEDSVPTVISDLTDVNAPAPGANTILKYTSPNWLPVVDTVSTKADVTTTNRFTGDQLLWDGASTYVHQTASPAMRSYQVKSPRLTGASNAGRISYNGGLLFVHPNDRRTGQVDLLIVNCPKGTRIKVYDAVTRNVYYQGSTNGPGALNATEGDYTFGMEDQIGNWSFANNRFVQVTFEYPMTSTQDQQRYGHEIVATSLIKDATLTPANDQVRFNGPNANLDNMVTTICLGTMYNGVNVNGVHNKPAMIGDIIAIKGLGLPASQHQVPHYRVTAKPATGVFTVVYVNPSGTNENVTAGASTKCSWWIVPRNRILDATPINTLSDVNAVAPTSGQVLSWDGISNWVNTTPAGGGGVTTATTTQDPSTDNTLTIAGSTITLDTANLDQIRLGNTGSGTDSNLAVGRSALSSLTSGLNNTSLGVNTLSTGTTASGNVCIGNEAGNDVTGNDNTLIGYLNGTKLGSAFQNTAVGGQALEACVTGGSNVAVGFRAAEATTSGETLAIGANCLRSQTSGFQNTGVGYFALNAVTTGNNNVATGYGALQTCTGSNNCAVGASAMTNSVGASFSTGLGTFAIPTSTGDNNTCVGYNSGVAMSSGNNNTFLGSSSATAATTCSKNVVLGSFCGGALSTGTNNVVVGNSANLTTGSQTNSTALGYQANATASNQVRIGNGSVADVKLGTDLANGATADLYADNGFFNTAVYAAGVLLTSDERDKADIRDSQMGFDVLDQLKVKRYRMAPRDGSAPAKKESLGLIAQEMEKVDLLKDLDIVCHQDKNDQYRLNYMSLIPILINCINSLNKRVSQLEKSKDKSKD